MDAEGAVAAATQAPAGYDDRGPWHRSCDGWGG